jgi:hypothetical protein
MGLSPFYESEHILRVCELAALAKMIIYSDYKMLALQVISR